MPSVRGLDDRRGYEIYPGPPGHLQDSEGRHLDVSVEEETSSLKIVSVPAKITVMWRYQHPAGVTVNGQPLDVQLQDDFATVSFTHTGDSAVIWH